MARRRALMSQMNVVPYIDVMLVLLVIFMVTAQMIQLGEVQLPSVAQLPAPTSEAAVVVIHADGSIGLKKTATAPEVAMEPLALLRALRALQAERPDLAVVIAADRRVTYETVMGMLDRLRGAGFARVGLQTSTGEGRKDAAPRPAS
ncbi:ExbD/TolR family protein [Hydrogenophilus thermoluteolus]|uniref:ExbD/TolR family protein n=1 Tax=Hydrogenophilus thermoluteolus TaxID=297 RepID=UPI003F67192B